MLFSPLADGLHARHAQRAGRAGHACPDRATRVWMLPLDVELRTRHDASARKAESRACACAGKWRAWGPSLWRPNALLTLKISRARPNFSPESAQMRRTRAARAARADRHRASTVRDRREKAFAHRARFFLQLHRSTTRRRAAAKSVEIASSAASLSAAPRRLLRRAESLRARTRGAIARATCSATIHRDAIRQRNRARVGGASRIAQ